MSFHGSERGREPGQTVFAVRTARRCIPTGLWPNLLCTATPTITQSSLFDRCSKAMIRLTRCTSIRARGGSVHELAQFHPVEKQFVCYHVMTYLAFYKSDERKGRGFEVCSGALGSSAA